MATDEGGPLPDDLGYGQGRRGSDYVGPYPSPCGGFNNYNSGLLGACYGQGCNVADALVLGLLELLSSTGSCGHTAPSDAPPLRRRTFAYESRPYAHHSRGMIRRKPKLKPAPLVATLVPPRLLVNAEIKGSGSDERPWYPDELVREDTEPVEATPITDDELLRGTALAPDTIAALPEWFDNTQRVAFQLGADLALIDGNSFRLRPYARVFTETRWELDAEAALYHLAKTDRRADIDWITVSALRLGARVVQTTALQARLTGGPVVYTGGSARLGAEGGLSFDAFVHKPLILSGTANFGRVAGALFIDTHGSVGVIIGAVEIMGGFAYTRLTGRTFAGPTAGVRLWF